MSPAQPHLPSPKLDFDARRMGAVARASWPIVLAAALLMVAWWISVEHSHVDLWLALELGLDPTGNSALVITVLPMLAIVAGLLLLLLRIVFAGYVSRPPRPLRDIDAPSPRVRAEHPTTGDHRPPRHPGA